MDKLSILKEIDKLIQEFNDKHNPKKDSNVERINQESRNKMTIEQYQEKHPEYEIQNSIKGKFLTVHKPDFNSYLEEKYHELLTVHSTGKISIGGWWNHNLDLDELKDIISLSEWFITNFNQESRE